MKLPIYLKSKIVKRFQIPNNWKSRHDDTFLPLEQETVDDTMALNIETRQSCIISTWQAYPAYCISNDAPPRHAISDVEVRIFYHANEVWWDDERSRKKLPSITLSELWMIFFQSWIRQHWVGWFDNFGTYIFIYVSWKFQKALK